MHTKQQYTLITAFGQKGGNLITTLRITVTQQNFQFTLIVKSITSHSIVVAASTTMSTIVTNHNLFSLVHCNLKKHKVQRHFSCKKISCFISVITYYPTKSLVWPDSCIYFGLSGSLGTSILSSVSLYGIFRNHKSINSFLCHWTFHYLISESTYQNGKFITCFAVKKYIITCLKVGLFKN